MALEEELQTLSKRAVENVVSTDHWAPLVAALDNPWSEANPDGMTILGLAENSLMHAELQEHITKNFHIDPTQHFTYGNGPQGSPRLRKALTAFFNSRFHPLRPTSSEEFVLTTGVTALIDHLAWCICADGEAILFPRPLYAGFTNDVPQRARGNLVPVSFEREDRSLDLNDVFDPEANTRAFEQAYRVCERDGVKVRGVMVTNPHNPLGKCYPVETIKAIAVFCAKYNLHYLSDEIYAMSTFSNPHYPNATPFTSVLSVPVNDILEPAHIHVLYGMSKDFCANGLRLGALHSRNSALRAAVTGIALFSWQAYLMQDIWARVLEDEAFLDHFITENQRRLAARYAMVTEFLREKGIRFFEGGNAGFFLWMDLRDLLWRSGDVGDETTMMVSSPASQEYQLEEERLAHTWWDKGVMISRGSGCLSEEYGWFRIIFTVDEGSLRVGLQRFVDGLQEVRAQRECAS